MVLPIPSLLVTHFSENKIKDVIQRLVWPSLIVLCRSQSTFAICCIARWSNMKKKKEEMTLRHGAWNL